MPEAEVLAGRAGGVEVGEDGFGGEGGEAGVAWDARLWLAVGDGEREEAVAVA